MGKVNIVEPFRQKHEIGTTIILTMVLLDFCLNLARIFIRVISVATITMLNLSEKGGFLVNTPTIKTVNFEKF